MTNTYTNEERDRIHALNDELNTFFGALKHPDDRVKIFPRLSQTKYRHYEKYPDLLFNGTLSKDGVIGKRSLFDRRYGQCRLYPVLPRAITRKAVTEDTRTTAQLLTFNNLGYDIFWVPNPLKGSRRLQIGIQRASFLLLESDEDSLEDQRTFSDMYRNDIIARVFTGCKSCHSYVCLESNRSRRTYFADPKDNLQYDKDLLWNPNCVSDLRYLNSVRSGSCEFPEFRTLANIWEDRAEEHGISLDLNVLRDFSRLTRVPGFVHSKTGEPAKIEFLNPEAKWNYPVSRYSFSEDEFEWVDDMESDHVEAYIEPPEDHEEQLEAQNPFTTSSKGICIDDLKEFDPWSIQTSSVNYLKTEASFSLDQICTYNNYPGFHTTSTISPGCSVNPLNYLSNSPTSIDSESDHSRLPAVGPSSSPTLSYPDFSYVEVKGDWISQYQVYLELNKNGIPRKGMRRQCHPIMMTMKNLFEWDEQQVQEEWEEIIGISMGKFRCPPEKALELFREYSSGEHMDDEFHLRLPNLTKLPSWTNDRRKLLRKNLQGMLDGNINDEASILRNVVYKKIKTVPAQCKEGTLGIKTTDMAKVCKRYRPALDRLYGIKIMELTNEKFFPCKRTRTYRINIPMILILMGFKNDELDWSQAVTAPEATIAATETSIA